MLRGRAHRVAVWHGVIVGIGTHVCPSDATFQGDTFRYLCAPQSDVVHMRILGPALVGKS